MYNIGNVNPGDLIRAAYIDSLVQAILDLNARVAKLEGQAVVAGGPVIYSATSPVTLGAQLTVVGANFQTPFSNDTVVLGTTTITQFQGTPAPGGFSFLVPNTLPNVTLAGTPMTLSITNASGAKATYPVTVQAPTTLGTVGILFDTGPTQNLIGASTMTLGFTVTTTFPTGGPYGIQVAASVGSASGWNLAFLDANMNPTNSATSTFNVNGTGNAQTQKVWLQVTATSASATAANLVLTVSSTSPGVQAPAFPTPNLGLTYGAKPPAPDNRVLVSLASWSTPAAQNNTAPPVSVKAGSALTMGFNVTTNTVGTYQATFSMPSGWVPANTGALTQALPANTTGTANTGLPVSITYTAPTTPGTATLLFTVQQTATPAFSLSFTQLVTVTS